MKDGYAYMILKDKNGFTMIEQIFTLMIILMLLPIVQLLILYVHSPTDKFNVEMNDAANAIFQMVLSGYDVNVVDNRLRFKNQNNQTVLIEKYNQLIRRRVDGEGHEIISRDIKQLIFSMDKDILSFEITMKNNENIKKQINVNAG